MTFVSRTTSTRPATPSHRPWEPLPYMLRAVEHLTTHRSGGLALDPGLRKTSITLEAFCRLQEQGTARTMLVVAPLRVCRTVWRQEGAKWSEFRHLVFSLLHGKKKDDALKADADIYLINPEGIEWLCKRFFGRPLPFDVVTIDELTKFKNSQADRSKALRPRLAKVAWRWGLTGSLAPNGFMDLFGQMLMLDDGAALGRYITHYRDSYFQVGYDGFTYDLMPGAEQRIVQRIAPYWLQMSADDYMELPEIVPDVREIELSTAARKTYDKMKRDMIAALPEGIVTAANAAATYSKLSQMANGAVYVGDQKKVVAKIHDGKLDAVEELLEELNGQPLLLAYEFNHDLDRLRERFGADLPYLGKGTTEKDEAKYIAAWNRNELPILAAHPASVGHGLNLQEGNAWHICWFGIPWDLELWWQFIRRLRRSGNTQSHIMNHMLVVKGSIDELKLDALDDKDTTQGRLLKALNMEIRRDAETLAAGGSAVDYRRKDPMVMKLSRPGQTTAAPTPAAPAPAAAEGATRVMPKGWGNKPEAQAETARPAAEGQRERIQEQLTGAAEQPAAPRSAFSRGVQDTAREISHGGERVDPAQAEQPAAEAPAPRTRRSRTAAAPPPEAPTPESNISDKASAVAAICAARVATLAIAFNDPSTSVEDGLEIADKLWEWASAF